jgi:hypothetical protein
MAVDKQDSDTLLTRAKWNDSTVEACQKTARR